ncbi:YciI family protein [Massilia sp. IC2-477]|uniref:YciI family protein n=1 Tax=Massilia sp. IC2-477 TaxID=2887198 RepID=UPI001D12F881|nr:YciI family protein [Massilia sp. IC2-477]MCC2955828.1 YciI family protein [Massilia sp. IC2-477]
MSNKMLMGLCASLLLAMQPAAAQTKAAEPAPQYDAALAKSLGADERGMRPYVFVILKTGPRKIEDKAERDKVFQGHFANMGRLAAEKKLVVAGPLDGKEGRRGIFIIATPDIEEARRYVETDPVIVSGLMEAEYHKLYGSAALVMVNEVHGRIEKKQ